MRLVVAAAAAGLIALACPGQGHAQDVAIALAPGEVLLKVQAEGVYRSRPDVMTIQAGVVTTGATAREALQANGALASKLIETLRSRGVEPRDVRTQELSVNPQFDDSDRERASRESRQPRILGYIAANRVELRLRDLARAPDLVDALFTAGANSVRGPTFSLSNPDPALREARRAAVAAAGVEAATYAEALNMRIARVLRVSERGDFGTDGNTIMVMARSASAPPIEPGELSTKVTIWIDYAMVPR